MESFISRFVREDEGQGMPEYALILVLVSIVAIVALTTMGEEILGVFNDIVTAFQSV
ncbi:MAG: Flp family type IVb pilin [Chloroflexi bacterium]|nr:Flp family type IVb pilin [Chloroflexota bacterium]